MDRQKTIQDGNSMMMYYNHRGIKYCLYYLYDYN